MQETNYQVRLGVKLSELRKQKDMTQEDVAKHIGIPRPSYGLIEAGKRHLETKELFSLANLLEFSIPSLLAEVFETEVRYGENADLAQKKMVFNYQKFKSVFLYILHECKQKENVGKVVLNKLLYFCDFNYYEEYGKYLTGLRYAKLPMGPVPGIQELVEQMKDNCEVKEVIENVVDFKRVRYIPLVKPDMNLLSRQELEVINKVISTYSNLTARDISNLSHEDAPWLETPNIGDEINYDLVFQRKKDNMA